MHKIHIRWVAVGILSGILTAGFALRARPVFAQTPVGQLINLLKSKIGFQYGDNADFLFTKETPNYIAYAGDKATVGGHRIMLAQDKAEVEFSFLSASGEATTSAQVATDSAKLTAADQTTLTLAEQILDRQATASGSVATAAATVIRESGIAPTERAILASASGILSAGSGQASGSANMILTQEEQDFLLLIQLKTRKITQSSQEINKDILSAIQEVNDVLSKAKLEEDEKERKVVFSSITSGIDMVYRLNENGIQQEISIANPGTHMNIFTFALNTHGLTYKDTGHGVWYFSDRTGYVMRFPKAWATDENGTFTNDVVTTISKQNGKDVVTITVSPSWLADTSRSYPVTIHSALEVVPELRDGHPGAADARALRIKNLSLPVPTITAPVTPPPTLTPKPVETKSATPTATRAQTASPSATPTMTITPTPVATGSGVLEETPSATHVPEASGSSTFNWFGLIKKVYAAETGQTNSQGPLKISAAHTFFSIREKPQFTISENPGFVKKGIRFLQTAVTGKTFSLKNGSIDITNQHGQKIRDAHITETATGVSVVIDPQAQLSPGKYTLKYTFDGEEVTQDFTWGVLVINTNKATYLTGDSAYVQMSSLDEKGSTLCDSHLKLEITDPQGHTAAPDIEKSGTCKANNVTDNPDYFTHYQTGAAGTYQMKLTNLDNGFEVKDSFEVKDRLPFEIERIGATRINPFDATYTMTIKVKANQAFTGDIKEHVPANFQLIHSKTDWTVHLAAGKEQTFSYTYQAPKVSPEIFSLGPLTVGTYTESRQWQLASDASHTSYNCTWSGGTSTAWETPANWGTSCNGTYPHNTTQGANTVDYWAVVDLTSPPTYWPTLNAPTGTTSVCGVLIGYAHTGQQMTINSSSTSNGVLSIVNDGTNCTGSGAGPTGAVQGSMVVGGAGSGNGTLNLNAVSSSTTCLTTAESAATTITNTNSTITSSGSNCTWNQTGNQTLTSNGTLSGSFNFKIVGTFSGGSGTLNMSGGTFTQQTNTGHTFTCNSTRANSKLSAFTAAISTTLAGSCNFSGAINISASQTLTSGSNTHECSYTGTCFTLGGSAVLTTTGSTWIFSGDGSSISATALSFVNVTVHGTTNITVNTGAANHTVTGTLTVGANADSTLDVLSINSSQTLTSDTAGTITMYTDSSSGKDSITGSGTLIIKNNNLTQKGTISSLIRLDGSSGNCTQMPERDNGYEGNVEIYSNSSTNDRSIALATAGSKTVTMTGSLSINNQTTNTHTLTLTGATNAPAVNIVDISFTKGGSAGAVNLITGAGAWASSGTVNLTNSTFTATTNNTFTLSGASKQLTSVSQSFYNLTITGTITTADATSVTNDLTVNGTSFTPGNSVTVNDNIIVTQGTLAMGGNNLTVGSATSNSGSIKVASGASPAAIISQTGGTTTVTSSSGGSNCIGANSSDCSGSAGTIGFYNLTIGNASVNQSTTMNGTSTTISVGGNLLVQSAVTTSTTFTMSGTSPILNITGNLTVTPSASSNTNFTISGSSSTVNLTGNFVTNVNGSYKGVFSAGGTVNIAGDFTNNGTFTANSSSVVLNKTSGTQNVTGATTFYNLTATATSARSVLFKQSTTYTVTHAVNFSGSTCQALTLNHQSGDTLAWSLTTTGASSRTLDRLSVAWSNSDVSVTATHSDDGGNNNANWHFTGGSCTVTVSGTVYDTTEGSPVTSQPLVRVKVNGSGDYSANADGSGVYSVDVSMSAGNSLTVYLDTGGGITGATFTRSTGTSMSNIHIYQNRATIRCDNSNCSLTNDDIYKWDKTGDSDIHADVDIASGGALTVDNDWKLLVVANTFAPGGTVTTTAGGATTYAGHVEIISGAVLNMAGYTLSIGGVGQTTSRPLIVGGTYTTGSNTTTFTGGSTSDLENFSYYNLTINGTGPFSPTATLTVNNDLVITSGTLALGAYDLNVGTTSGGGNIKVAGVISQTGGTTLVKTVISGTNCIGANGTNCAGTPGTIGFYNLTIGAAGMMTTDIAGTTGPTVTVANVLNITVSATLRLGATTNLTLSGAGTPITKAGTLDVTTNPGSTVTYTSTSGVTALSSADTTFHNLTINGTGTFTAGRVYTVNGDLTVASGTFALGTNNLTVGSTSVASSGSIKVAGTISQSSSATTIVKAASGSNCIGANGTSCAGTPGTIGFGNLQIGDGSVTVSTAINGTTPPTVTVGGNLTIKTNATLSANGTLNVAGNWTSEASSVFTPNSSTVNLNAAADTTQIISGNTTFYNLTATGGDRILDFGAGDTFTIGTSGTFTATGDSCTKLVVIRSTIKGTAVNITKTGSISFSYVDAQDLNVNAAGATIGHSVNSGNNTNLTFTTNNDCISASTYTDSTATGYSFQRKTFYDDQNLRYWTFNHDGDEIEVRYSSDGTTWNNPATAASGHLPYNTNDFSVWFKTISSTQYVWLAVAVPSGTNQYDILVRRGTLTTTDISWDSEANVVALNGTGASDSYSYPYFSLDSSNFMWVGARYYNGTNYVYKAVRSDVNDTGDATWSTVGFGTTVPVTQISNDQTNANVFGNIVPLASQDMYAAFAVNTSIKGCVWNNSTTAWKTSDGTASCVPTAGGGETIGVGGAAVNIDDASDFGVTFGTGGRQVVRTKAGVLYSFLNDGGNCEMWKSTDGTSWAQMQSGTSIGCNTSILFSVAMAIDGKSNQDIHVAYVYGADLYYRNYDVATDNWDAAGQELIYEETHVGTLDQLNEVDLTVDSNNIPHVAFISHYEDYGTDEYYVVDYSNRVGGSWNGAVEVEQAALNSLRAGVSITIDMDNKPQVSYWKASANVVVARGNANKATAFSDKTTVDSSVSTAEYTTSISVDTLTGNTWVAYIDSTGYVALAKHLYADGWSTWSTITTKTDVGYDPSIAIAGSSDIYVLYQDDGAASNGSLKRISYDVYHAGAASPSWGGESALETPSSGNFSDVKAKWSFEWNNYGANKIDFLYSDGTDVFWNYLYLRRSPTKINDASDFGAMLGNSRQVVRTSGGTLYTFIKAATNCQIWKSADGASWSHMDSGNDQVCGLGGSARSMALAIDSSNNLGMTYFGDTGAVEFLYYNTFNTSTDTFGTHETIQSINTTTGARFLFTHSDLAFDSNDKPHAVYVVQNDLDGTHLAYVNKVGTDWADYSDLVVEATGPDYPGLSISFNSSNYPIVSAIDRYSTTLTAFVGDANNPTTFTSKNLDTSVNTTDGQSGTTIATDSSNNIWVAYTDASTNYITLFKHNSGDGWSSWQPAATDSKVGYEPSVAIDGSDVYVFYTDDQDDIVYDKYNGSWSGEKLLEEHAALQDVKTRWSYLNSYDSTGVAPVQTNTYYFDNSDDCSGGSHLPCDPGSHWTNGADAFDSSPETGAETHDIGQHLQGNGTNAPDSGGTIVSVKARVRGYANYLGSADTVTATIQTSDSQTLGDADVTSLTAAWGSYTTLSTPTGGWTWSKIQSLEAILVGGGLTDNGAYMVQLLVESTNTTPQNEIDYLYDDGTDVFYNRALLGGTANPGTQDTIATTTNGVAYNLSAVSDAGSPNDVHLLYLDDSATKKVVYNRWDNNGTSSAWQTPVTIDETGSSTNLYVNLTLNTTTKDLIATWIDQTSDDNVYSRQCTVTSASDECSTSGKWGTRTSKSTATGAVYNSLTTNYSAAGKVFSIWTNNAEPPFAVTWVAIVSGGGNSAPYAPTLLYVNERATTAQSGELSPVVAVGDATPVLSAYYDDPDKGNLAYKYRLIVYSDGSCTNVVWDSSPSDTGTDMAECTQGNRCSDITFGGTALPFDGATYYWRIKYWDTGGLAGPYSGCTDNFTILGPANQLRHGMYFFNNATKRVYTW
jgi:hypothetical protein